MKKDDWIKILIPVIITWAILLGVSYMVTFNPNYLWAGPIILIIVLFICIKYFSEPGVKELLKSRLKRFISYWEDKEREFWGKSPEIGNELKRIVLENEKLLLPTIADEVSDIADSIIIFSNQTIILADENDDIRKRISQEMIREGDELVERAKELIKKMK